MIDYINEIGSAMKMASANAVVARAAVRRPSSPAMMNDKYQKLLADFPVHNRNNALLGHIQKAMFFGISCEQIRSDLRNLPQNNKPGDPLTFEEIDRALDKARTSPSFRSTLAAPSRDGFAGTVTKPLRMDKLTPTTSGTDIAAFSAGEANLDTLKSLSPYKITGGSEDAVAFLQAMFLPKDLICIGSTMSNHPQSIYNYLNRLESLGNFVTINPFKPDTTRSDKNVAAFRNMLVEFDPVDKEKALADSEFLRSELNKQAGFWAYMIDQGFPILALTYSGSKSIHAIFRVNIADVEAWGEQIEKRIYPLFGRLGADRANKNPSRFSRMPTVLRDETAQELLYLNPAVVAMNPDDLYDKLAEMVASEPCEVAAPEETTLYDYVPDILRSRLTDAEKIRAIGSALLEDMLRNGVFFKTGQARNKADIIYLDNRDRVAMRLSDPLQVARIAKKIGLVMSNRVFPQIMDWLHIQLIDDSSVAKIEMQSYWCSNTNGIYISCNDHEFVKISASGISMLPNGSDGIVFPQNAVLKNWNYGENECDLNAMKLWREASLMSEDERKIVLAWTELLPFAVANKPILCVIGEPGSGKTQISKGAARLWGLPMSEIQPGKNEHRIPDEFWLSLAKGGVVMMDNVDSVYKWLPDALANYSTGGHESKRKLYTDDEMLNLMPNAALVINSSRYYFANDPGCNARLLVVRLKSREAIMETNVDSELGEEIDRNRDALISTICRKLMAVMGDSKPVTAPLYLRHPDWGQRAVKLGRAMGEEESMIKAIQENQNTRVSIALENDPLAIAIEKYLSEGGRRELSGCLEEIKTLLSCCDQQYNYCGCSIQKFTSIFHKLLPTFKRIYHIEEKTVGGSGNNRTRYTIKKR